MIKKRSVGIIGAGNVEVAAAYSIFNQHISSEIIVIDKDRARARGEAMDLMHGQLLVGNTSVIAGDYKDLSNTQVIVISAGVSQQSSSDTRLDLLNRNIEIFEDIIQRLDHHAPDTLLVIATNPVDILTYAAQQISNRSTR